MTFHHAALGQILLVIFLGLEKWPRGKKLGHDRTVELPAAIMSIFRRPGGALLFWRVEENRRTILVADVGTLAIDRGGVVDFPEDLEKLVVRHLLRIENVPGRFRVSRLAGTDLLGTRADSLPAGITYRRIHDPREPAKRGFNTPKTTGCERGFFHRPAPFRPRAPARATWHAFPSASDPSSDIAPAP